MKTLSEIKNEVAKGRGFKDWEALYTACGKDYLHMRTNEVAKRYAEEALKEAAEIIENKEYNVWDATGIKDAEETKQKILNLIKELK